MKGRPWTPEEDARLRELYPRTPTRELPALFDRSRLAIKVRAASLHLRKEDEASAHRPWRAHEDALIRALFADTPTEEVARQLGRSYQTVAKRAATLGMRKSAAFLASPRSGRLQPGDARGKRSRFQPGNTPPTKGIRRPGYARGRMRETQFREGQMSWNQKPIGSERLAGGYRWTKIADVRGVPWTKNWRQTHVLLWEQHHGPIPPKHALVFKNGDRSDVRLENLELIPRSQLMARNTVHNLPAPLPQAIQLLGALKRKINRMERATP